MKAKICGIKNLITLKYIISHPYPPDLIGFIINYPKSRRFIKLKNLNNLVAENKKKSKFVAVLVDPKNEFLEKIKYLNFDYYQIYDANPSRINEIKNKYNKKIITAITIEESKDVEKYKLYKDISEIILFDSKGYEKSLSFDHSLIKNIKCKSKIMIAGNIKYDDQLEKFNEIADIVDISGGLETSGKKDISKIDIFLNNLGKLKDEN